MRIFVITREEPFYVPIYLSKLLQEKHNDIIGAAIATIASPHLSILQLYQLAGFRGFILQGLELILFKTYNILNAFIPFKRFYSIRKMMRRYNIPMYKIAHGEVNSQEFVEILRSLKPDLILSVANSQILKKQILEIPGKGAINVHGSLLPKYRGILAAFWVLANNEKETGVSIHYMNPEIDDGKIIVQQKIGISEKDSIHSLYRKISTIGASLILEAVTLIENKKVVTKPNDETKATYFLKPKKHDIQRFRKQGRSFR